VETLVNRPLPSTVLVTGASGFLGGHVAAALLGRGIRVKGMVRSPAVALPSGTIPVAVEGLDDVAGIRRALDGVKGVIHLAARVHEGPAPGDAAVFRAVNLEGTRRLLEEAIGAGVKAFVFFSSVKAVGESSPAPWTELTPPAPVDGYGITKLEAEIAVRELAARHQVHATILRLPLVYGPGMKANALRLFQLVDRGLPLPLGGIRNRRSLLFSGNLIAALLATLENTAGDDTFFVSDGEDLSTPELIEAIGRALGRRAPLFALPGGLLRATAHVGDSIARVLPFPLTTAVLDRLAGSLAVDCSKLRRLTGYAPPYSVAEGLRLTAEWYRNR
jgi:nucleoside-diphosphate-sugar epimerase